MIDDLLPDQTKRFGTWQNAKDLLRSLEGQYVFRGMGNADWDLLTTLNRTARYRSSEAEEVLIESFQKAFPDHISHAPPRDDRVSWLALMRHYGLPSRLLDCTESHAVAAYFAAETESNCDFAIWAIQKDELQRSAEASLGILIRRSAPVSPLELGNSDLFSAAFLNAKRFVALVDSNHKSQRQQAQQGLFLCPGDPGYPFWYNFLSDIVTKPGFMYRVVLPQGARNEIMDDLSGNEINHANLLPDTHDLEKLCDTLEMLLKQSQERHGQFQWKLKVKPLLMEHGLLEIKSA